MPRDDRHPISDAELTAASDAIQHLRAEVRADLADDLGGDPDDYRADGDRPVLDDGE